MGSPTCSSKGNSPSKSLLSGDVTVTRRPHLAGSPTPAGREKHKKGACHSRHVEFKLGTRLSLVQLPERSTPTGWLVNPRLRCLMVQRLQA